MKRNLSVVGSIMVCLQLSRPALADPDEIADALDVERLPFIEDLWSRILVSPSIDYAMSDPLTGDNDEAYLGLNHTVDVDSVVAFEWAVNSRPNLDFLTFDLDDSLNPVDNRISGVKNYSPKMYEISAGGHYLTWRYRENEGEDLTAGAGYLNHLIFVERDVDLTRSISGFGTAYPAGSFTCGKGTHKGVLVRQSGQAKLVLELQYWNNNRWNTVGTSKDTNSERYQAVSVFVGNWKFRWKVTNTNGYLGTYRVVIEKPFCY